MSRSSRSLWTQKILSGNVEKSGTSGKFSLRDAAETFPNVISGTRIPYTGFVLGIDPSLRGSGFAVVEFSRGNAPKLHFSKTLKIARDVSLATCLGEIYKLCADCCEDFPVRHVALEETIYVTTSKWRKCSVPPAERRLRRRRCSDEKFSSIRPCGLSRRLSASGARKNPKLPA